MKKPKRFCTAYPCNNLVRSGERYCEAHQPAKPNRDSDPFYNTARWQRFRNWYRAKNPLCERCLDEGLTVPADMVDHIIEIRDGGAKLSATNAQSLCNGCHAVKSAAERKRRGPVVYSY